MAHGLCRGHLFMAFRLMVASSSLWPPDRKVMPGVIYGGKSDEKSKILHLALQIDLYIAAFRVRTG